jgi:hypothetical protein
MSLPLVLEEVMGQWSLGRSPDSWLYRLPPPSQLDIASGNGWAARQSQWRVREGFSPSSLFAPERAPRDM